MPRLTKIVATVGPASIHASVLRPMLEHGVDVVRINASHGDIQFFALVTQRVRQLASELQRTVAILLDLRGPKMRVGRNLAGGAVELVEGTEPLLEPGDFEGDATRIPVSYAALAADTRPGDRVLLDDGLLELEVLGVEGDALRARVLSGGTLRPNKGINVPGRALSASAFDEKDLVDLQAAIDLNLDYVALSFVRDAEDLRKLRAEMHRRGGAMPIVAKIEKPQALEHIDEVLRESDAVMVARGDLGVEIAPERVPGVQKSLIARAALFGVPVITATQMLESMMENPRPTRAEASDVANAIFDGSDAVMLSGETAAGRYPLESVRMMDRIAREAESSRASGPRSLRESRFRVGLRAMAQAAKRVAEEVDAKTFVVYTLSGTTALALSKLDCGRRIVGLSPDPAVCRRMCLYHGVLPLSINFQQDTDAMLRQGDQLLLELGLAELGERVVVMGGSRQFAGATDMVQLRRLGGDG